MPIDHGSETSQVGDLPIERLIDRAEVHDETWRTANWVGADLANRPDRDTWLRESAPLTPQEQARSEADDSDGRDIDHPPETDRTSSGAGPDEVRDTDAAYRQQITITFDDSGSLSDVDEPTRPLSDQPPGPNEPTTELYRTEGNLRYERPEVTDDPDLELQDNERTRYDKTVDWAKKRETAENLKDAGDYNIRLFERIVDPPRATGAYVGTADDPTVRAAPREATQGGELLIAGLAAALVADRAVRWGHGKFDEWKLSRGDRDDAGS